MSKPSPTKKAIKAKASENYITEVLQQDLPKSESKELEKELQWNFVLDKHSLWDKKQKPIKKRKQFLTRKERKKLNLLKLPKNNWKYEELDAIRQLWKEYMRRNLDLVKKAPTTEDPTWCNFNVTLAKSEFIGAEISVIRSSVPSTVGITGTVVLETKSTFQIVTPKSDLKTLLKKPSVFEFNLDNMRFTVFGKHMVVKPGERTVKKIKSQMIPDLV